MSQPVLAISLFFHILATVVWIGGMMVITLLVIPELQRVLAEAPMVYHILRRLRKRFWPISNLALAVLIITGLFQMTADPHYDGLLNFDNAWSRTLLLKHALIVLMASAGLILQFVMAPRLERMSLLMERGKGDAADWRRLRRREKTLSALMMTLALMILAVSVWLAAI